MQFYDFEFNLLLDTGDVVNWRYTKYFNAMGTFQARFHISSPVTKLVMQHKYLVCTFSGEAVIITGKEIGKYLTIYGRSCDWLLKKRVVLPYGETERSTGEQVKTLFENAYSDCESVIFGNYVDGEMRIFSQNYFRDLYNCITQTLTYEKLGYEFLFDAVGKKWIFNILKGNDLDYIISEGCKNASSLSITNNISDIANYCYYDTSGDMKGKGSDEEGLYRFETYINSDDEAECDRKLEECKNQWWTEIKTVGVFYKEHYLLGDTLRVQIIKDKLKLTRRLRVKGVEMENSYRGYREKPIFEEV